MAPSGSAGRGVVGRIRFVALRLAFVVLTTGVAPIGAEYAARFVFRHARSSGNATDFVARRGGPAVVANHLGFRDPEIPQKIAGRYRIDVLGDSFAWGQGIEVGERVLQPDRERSWPDLRGLQFRPTGQQHARARRGARDGAHSG